jgi:phosphoenolpyruvate carboxykinase (ATP)
VKISSVLCDTTLNNFFLYHVAYGAVKYRLSNFLFGIVFLSVRVFVLKARLFSFKFIKSFMMERIPNPVIRHLQFLKLHNHSVNYQCSLEELIADALELKEGELADNGALVICTGAFTGRSPKDKYITLDGITREAVNWGEINIPLDYNLYENLYSKLTEYISRKKIWVRDCWVCADPQFRMGFRVITETASANLFAYNMFLRPTEKELEKFIPEWQLIFAPGFKADPKKDSIRSPNFAIIDFFERMIIIGGTGYTGEIKKAVFTILNYHLPKEKNVLPMHCAANVDGKNNTALFFGLSGTGKTTLSADPYRKLIGDDEHGWSEKGVFNFEGGCYAKCIDLNKEKEPQIFNAIRKGALVENTCFHKDTNTIAFNDKSVTENTRISYPLHYIDNAQSFSLADHPKNIFFLSCDAYGVLPPISKLSTEQAIYHFLSGYTAKIAGTEAGIAEPVATFSPCFSAPFLPLSPFIYARMLEDKIKKMKVNVWLINTGWTGGGHGKGRRIQLKYTREMIKAVLNNEMKNPNYKKDVFFELNVPTICPGVPPRLLDPRNTWHDRAAYDKAAQKLKNLFEENFLRLGKTAKKDNPVNNPIGTAL